MRALSSRINRLAPVSRNPERTRERIFKAAFREFADEGFAGARVDRIARRAGINKRMLYHYFGDKEALFREVLRRKMAQRLSWTAATPDDPSKSLPYWFELACKDMEWIRLLEWEALHFIDRRLIDEERRRTAVAGAVGRIRARQKMGHLSTAFTAKQTLLAMTALTWFPLAFPQLTRLIMGLSVSGERFQAGQKEFLRKFAAAFEAAGTNHHLRFSARGNGQTKLKSQ
jgi:AcrR family transcriptional regulator